MFFDANFSTKDRLPLSSFYRTLLPAYVGAGLGYLGGIQAVDGLSSIDPRQVWAATLSSLTLAGELRELFARDRTGGVLPAKSKTVMMVTAL